MWMILFVALCSSLIINALLLAIAFRWQSDKLTDISYALSFLAIDTASFIYGGKLTVFNWVLFLMVALWAVRIGGFLLIRVLKVGKDRRFDGMRESFVRFSKFWLGQAFTAWVLMFPVTIALQKGGDITGLVILGMLSWLLGLLIEAVADKQKFAFKQDSRNQGKWIEEGIWKYARHPNYFGEMLVWIGLYISCFETLNGLERLFGLASPVLISIVLLFVSGVPLLEKSADNRWGGLDAYKSYKKRTRLLVPLPKW